jgi:dihydrofolate reductase
MTPRRLGGQIRGCMHDETRRLIEIMATYTAHLFTTLDGFGTGQVGYWGKDGPELHEYQARNFFAAEGQTLVFGADTYRLMARFVGAAEGPSFAALNAAPKVVISRTLKEPLAMDNSTLVAGDALDAVPRLKAESPLPLRAHGSIAMNRALLAAGLVDRLEVTVFPVITGATGRNRVLADLPDIDLELVESRLFDGRIQHLAYAPTR